MRKKTVTVTRSVTPEVKTRAKPPHAHVAKECLLWTKDEPKEERDHCILDFELKCQDEGFALLLSREQALNMCADILDAFGVKKLEVPSDDVNKPEVLQ